MSVSIIIVNYKSIALLLDCLRSIYQFSSAQQIEVIVVDNDSGDESETILAQAYPQVRWIQMGYNAGFARANNEGIKQATRELVLLLNPDTIILKDAIAICAERLKNAAYIAASAQLLNEDGTPQITGNFFMKGGLNHLMALPYAGRFIRWLGYTLKVKKTNVPEATGAVEVDWINGAFLMVKKEAIKKAGLLDEDFFLYSEEIEWCSRLCKLGKLCVYGDLQVIHLQGATANTTFASEGQGYYRLHDKKGLQILLSGFVRIRKQFGVGWFIVHLLAHLCTIPLFFLILLLKTILFVNGTGKEWQVWKGFSANVLTVSGYFFTIVLNKPFFYKVL
jgi:GT2 family glycosyltransferase